MANDRELYFRIEKLDSNDVVVEEKTPVLISGEVTVSRKDIHRRKCRFTLAEALPDDWVSARWKLYYGQKINGQIEYDALGVFLPIDPSENETTTGKTTSYQGVDKMQLLLESYGEAPISFATSDTLKEVAQAHYDAISEASQNLDDLSYSLNTNYTFGEWRSAQHTLATLINSFTAETYYDKNGIAVLKALPPVASRAVAFEFPEGDDAIHVSVDKTEKNSNYWNKVIVLGGKVDEPIFRKELTDSDEVTRVGRTITKMFRNDVASSQQQVDDLADELLQEGTRIPAEITIYNLPLTNLEVNQIIRIGLVKYEVLSLNVPLGLGLQTIKAGRVE